MLSRRALLLQSAAAMAAGWPEFRGHGDSLGQAPDLPLTWGPAANLAWTAATPGYGQSSPVVWGNRVFLTSVSGPVKEVLHVFCLDLQSGRELWHRQFQAAQRIQNTGTTSKGAPTPCVDSSRLYVFFESGDLMALSHDGEPLWSRRLTEEYGPFQGNHGVGSSPRLTANGVAVLVAHGGPCYLLLADRATGKNLWRTERDTKVAWTTPSVMRRGEREQIIVSVNGRIESYDARDGRSVWFLDGIKGNLLSSATVAEDLLIVGSSDKGNVTAIELPRKDGESARIAWKADNATSYFGSPLVYHDRVWLSAKVGVGWCLDLRTGDELWSGRLAGECWASPVGAAGRVYFFSVNGVTQVYKADAPGEKLAANTLDEMERTYGVAIADKGFVLRSGRKVVKVSS